MNFRTVLLAVFLFILAVVPARAEEGSRVILVLDASGSMWGQIDGTSKMEIAKDVVGRVVGAWKPENELGLVAYGHREKGSCEDIEVLREPGVLDAGDYMSAVNALNPKGKTPMTAAVRMAAESLKYTERKASVILVSDGIETCDLDPCAVADELEKLGVDLTVHTVGFGLDNQGAVSQLKCLAEKTGGTYTTAENASELEAALTKTVEAAPAPAPEPAAPEFNVTGHVMMAEGVELSQGYESASWEFFDVVDGQKGQWLQTEYGTDIKINLPRTGDFIVRVSDDVAAVELPMTLEAGEVEKLNVSLEAGILRLSGMMDETTPMTDAGAAWELLDSIGQMDHDEVWCGNLLPRQCRRLQGSPRSWARQRRSRISRSPRASCRSRKLRWGPVPLKPVACSPRAGRRCRTALRLNCARAKPGLDGKHEWITTTYGTTAQFKVPAGKYLVIFNKDYAEGSAPVEVTAGAVSKVEVNLDGGYLAVTGPAESTIEVFSAEKDISGERKYLATEYGGAVNKAFDAGAYHVVAKGADGAVLGEKDFEVKAGGRTEGIIP